MRRDAVPTLLARPIRHLCTPGPEPFCACGRSRLDRELIPCGSRPRAAGGPAAGGLQLAFVDRPGGLLRLRGTLGWGTLDGFADALTEAAALGLPAPALDLSGLRAASSAGLHLLVAHRLRVVAVGAKVRTVILRLGLERALGLGVS